MVQRTQKAILQTFRQMLEEMPFDKITVSALVRRSEISPNTFYYHYQDIYALLDAFLREELNQYAVDEVRPGSWKTATTAFLYDCRAHAKIIYHISGSLSRERLEQYVFSQTNDAFYRQICLSTAGFDVPEAQLRATADFLRYAFVGFFLKFLWNKMSDDIDRSVDDLGALFHGVVAQMCSAYPCRTL